MIKANLCGSPVKAIALLFLLFGEPTYCQTSFPLAPKTTKTLVDSLAAQIHRFYILEAEAAKMSGYLKKRYKEGHYNDIGDPHLLAGLLTSDVLSVYQDEHFHVEYNPAMANEISGNIDDVPKMVAEKLEIERTRNFGFKKAEVLSGNIGYLEISSFSRLNKFSKATANAALDLLSNSDALIIDLRYGIGGSPDMVNHILGRLFKERTHYSDIYIRSEKVSLPYWTTPDSIPGRLADIPLFVLTSYKTFSAAEGLAYALQSMKRATVIGEVTRGGAHTVTYRPLSSGFITDLPFGRAIDPVSKKSWEGIGVIPDVKTTADKALEATEEIIFSKAIANSKDSSEIKKLRWQQELLRSLNHPLPIDSAALSPLAANYGAFELTLSNGSLYYQKKGKAKFLLLPMSANTFRPKGNDTFVVEISKNPAGLVTGIITRYDDGRAEHAVRTSK
jgi:retinol-binding protein 3